MQVMYNKYTYYTSHAFNILSLYGYTYKSRRQKNDSCNYQKLLEKMTLDNILD